MKYLVSTSLCVIVGASAFAAGAEVKVTGTYSNLTYNKESGDLGGTEISILFGAQAHYAVVQCAEGEPGVPIVVKIHVDGLKVSFAVPKNSGSGCPEAAYVGTVSAAGLMGQFSGFGSPELLQRKNSYWQ